MSTIKRYIFFILFTVALVLLTGCGKQLETNMSSEVMEFEAITQDEQTMKLNDLEGQWWVADFIFTNCVDVCLPMTANMAYLQQQMKEEELDAQLISFSVDPEFDTPEVLKEYGNEYGADYENWTFLTGYEFEYISELAIDSFQSYVAAPPEDSDQVTHGTRFYLVNPEGEIVKSYSGLNKQEMDTIVEDLKIVLK